MAESDMIYSDDTSDENFMVESNNQEKQEDSCKSYVKARNDLHVNLRNNHRGLVYDLSRSIRCRDNEDKVNKKWTVPQPKNRELNSSKVRYESPLIVLCDSLPGRLLFLTLEIKLKGKKQLIIFMSKEMVLLIVSIYTLILMTHSLLRHCRHPLSSSQYESSFDFFDVARARDIKMLTSYYEWFVSHIGRSPALAQVGENSVSIPPFSTPPKALKAFMMASTTAEKTVEDLPKLYASTPTVAPSLSSFISSHTGKMGFSKLDVSSMYERASVSSHLDYLTLDHQSSLRELVDHSSLQLDAACFFDDMPIKIPIKCPPVEIHRIVEASLSITKPLELDVTKLYEFDRVKLSEIKPLEISEIKRCEFVRIKPLKVGGIKLHKFIKIKPNEFDEINLLKFDDIMPNELGGGKKQHQGKRPKRCSSDGSSAKRHCTSPRHSSSHAGIGAGGGSGSNGGDDGDEWRKRKSLPRPAPPIFDAEAPLNKKGSKKSRKKRAKKMMVTEMLSDKSAMACKHKACKTRKKAFQRVYSPKEQLLPLLYDPDSPQLTKLTFGVNSGEVSSRYRSAPNGEPPGDNSDGEEDYTGKKDWVSDGVTSSRTPVGESISKHSPPTTPPTPTMPVVSTRKAPPLLLLEEVEQIVPHSVKEQPASKLPVNGQEPSSRKSKSPPSVVSGSVVPATKYTENGHQSEANSIAPRAPGKPGEVSADGQGSGDGTARKKPCSLLISGMERSYADAVISGSPSSNEPSTTHARLVHSPSVVDTSPPSKTPKSLGMKDRKPPQTSAAPLGQSFTVRKKQGPRQLQRANSCPTEAREPLVVPQSKRTPRTLVAPLGQISPVRKKMPPCQPRVLVGRTQNCRENLQASPHVSFSVCKKTSPQGHHLLHSQTGVILVNQPSCRVAIHSVVSSLGDHDGSGDTTSCSGLGTAATATTDKGSSSNGNSLQVSVQSLSIAPCQPSLLHAPSGGSHPASPDAIVLAAARQQPSQGAAECLQAPALTVPVSESGLRNNSKKLLTRQKSYDCRQEENELLNEHESHDIQQQPLPPGVGPPHVADEEAVQVSQPYPVDKFCLVIQGNEWNFSRAVPPSDEDDSFPVYENSEPASPLAEVQLPTFPAPEVVPSSPVSEQPPLVSIHVNGSGYMSFNTLAEQPAVVQPAQIQEVPLAVSDDDNSPSLLVFRAPVRYTRDYRERARSL